jgi:Protein of unknown function (DUF4231)
MLSIEENAVHPALQRLATEIEWYDRSANRKCRTYRSFKAAEIVAAAAVPAAAALGASTGLLAVRGGGIVILQGMQSLFQSQDRYLAHRSTYEVLKREEALFLAGAGPYRGVTDPETLLAERVEQIRESETTEWVRDAKRLVKPESAA